MIAIGDWELRADALVYQGLLLPHLVVVRIPSKHTSLSENII